MPSVVGDEVRLASAEICHGDAGFWLLEHMFRCELTYVHLN